MARFTSTLLFLFACLSIVFADNVCNGRAEYCNRIYSNVSQVGVHDSPFVGVLPTDNQDNSVSAQLQGGARLLSAQLHNNIFKTLSVCHTSCWELDAGPFKNFLSTVKKFLDDNPNEVVTLVLVKSDTSLSAIDKAFSDSGANKYTYVPPKSPAVLDINAWPTLGSMISSGKRLVVFVDYGTDMSKYPYLLDEFSYFFETPYDVTDRTFSQCNIDRPANSKPDGKMYMVNHFLDLDIFGTGILVPDQEDIGKTNAAQGEGSIGAQVGLCEGLYGRPPKAVLLDYENKGQAMQAQLAMNGLS